MSIQHTCSTGAVWEPLYRWHTAAHPVEVELLRSQPVRRLKYLHHYGASALFSPMTHSRFEHTAGVWSLTAHFFPDDTLLRIAAILHDIGHLPFSHAVERTLGYNHHTSTEKLIMTGVIAEILHRHHISPAEVTTLLQENNPLTNKTVLMGLDHLDSFLRDTYHAGRYEMHPAELVRSLRFNGCFLEADEPIALALIDAVVEDHKMMLQPEFLAMDALLAKAVKHHTAAHPGSAEQIPTLLDHELIQELQNSSSETARTLIHLLMYEPHRIQITDEPIPGSIQVQIGKLYKKQPLIGKKPATEASFEAAVKLAELDALGATYFFHI